MHRMLNCNNSIVNQCITNASHDANTLIGYKLYFFRSKFDYNLYDLGLSQSQCFPTGAPRSHCAPRCIVKGSARDDITNNKKMRNWTEQTNTPTITLQ